MSVSAIQSDTSLLIFFQMLQNGFEQVVQDSLTTFEHIYLQSSEECRSFLRANYIAQRRFLEAQFNADHAASLHDCEQQFETKHAVTKEKSPKLYEKEKLSHIFQKEQSLYLKERKTYWSQASPLNVPLFLKTLQGTFVQDRWLEDLLSNATDKKEAQETEAALKSTSSGEYDFELFNYQDAKISRKYRNKPLGIFALDAFKVSTELVTQQVYQKLGKKISLRDLYPTLDETQKKLLFVVSLTQCQWALLYFTENVVKEIRIQLPNLQAKSPSSSTRIFTSPLKTNFQQYNGCLDSLEKLKQALENPGRHSLHTQVKIELPKDFSPEKMNTYKELAARLRDEGKTVVEAISRFRQVLQLKGEEEQQKVKQEEETQKQANAPRQEKPQEKGKEKLYTQPDNRQGESGSGRRGPHVPAMQFISPRDTSHRDSAPKSAASSSRKKTIDAPIPVSQIPLSARPDLLRERSFIIHPDKNTMQTRTDNAKQSGTAADNVPLDHRYGDYKRVTTFYYSVRELETIFQKAVNLQQKGAS